MLPEHIMTEVQAYFTVSQILTLTIPTYEKVLVPDFTRQFWLEVLRIIELVLV